MEFFCKNNIFTFVLASAIIAISILFLPVDPEYNVVAFALMVYFWSLASPYTVGSLPNLKIDFWYYSFALLGIVLFYFGSSEDLKKLSIMDERDSALTSLKKYSRERDLFKNLSKDRDRLLKQIIAEAAKMAEQIPKPLTLEAQRDCIEKQALKKFMDSGRVLQDPKRPWEDYSVPSIKDAYCMAPLEHDSSWGVLATAKDFEQLRERATTGSPAKSSIEINGLSLSLPLVAKYIALKPNSPDWENEKKRLDTLIKKSIQSLESASNAYEKVGRVLENAPSSTLVRITKVLWPYLLIVAFGMRLAARDIKKVA